MPKTARFVWSQHGLLLETPVPLTPYQQQRAADFALPVFMQRHDNMPRGSRRDAVAVVIKALRDRRWTLRPTPKADCEKDLVLA